MEVTAIDLQELRESMQNFDSGFFSRIFGADALGLGEVDSELLVKEGTEAKQSQPQFAAHLSDAMNFSDFNEFVSDDKIFSDKCYKRGMSALQQSAKELSRKRMVNGDYDEDEEATKAAGTVSATQPGFVMQQSLSAVETAKPGSLQIPPHHEPVDIRKRFPEFDKIKVLKFSNLSVINLKHPPELHPKKRG